MTGGFAERRRGGAWVLHRQLYILVHGARLQRLTAPLRAFVEHVTRGDTRIAEFTSSTLWLALGAWMILSHATNLFEETAAWAAMHRIATRETWGMAFVVLGVVQSWANLAERRRWRGRAATASMLLWTWLSLLCWLDVPNTILAPIAPVVALVSVIVYLKLGRYGKRHEPTP